MQEGQGSPNGGNRLRVSLKILCFYDDTWFHLNLTFSNLGLNKPEFLSIVLWLGDDTPHAILSQKYILWERNPVKLLQP